MGPSQDISILTEQNPNFYLPVGFSPKATCPYKDLRGTHTGN